jgi:hypothetical protein
MVVDAFEAGHIAALRPNSRSAHRAPVRRLRARFGSRRLDKIGRADVR